MDLENHQEQAFTTAEHNCFKVFSQTASSTRKQGDFSASRYSYWKAVPNLTTWAVRNLHLTSNLNNS